MIKKKKLLSIMLVFVMIFSLFTLSACSKTEDDTSEKKEEVVEEVETEEEEDGSETTEEPEFQIDMSVPEETPEPVVCICDEKCKDGAVNVECPVCKTDITQCEGIEPELDPLDKIALPDGQTSTINIIAFGNNIQGNAVLNAAKKDTKYDFNYMYDKIKDTINLYDVRITSQNAILTPDASNYNGDYNKYQAPTSAGEAIVNAGFNVITQASPNAYVDGERGIKNTLNFWKQYPSVIVTGIYETEEAYNNISMADIKGIRVAFLNYTSSLNDTNLTNAEKHYIKTLSDETAIAQEIQQASKEADFVIVLPSWGSGKEQTPTSNEKKWAQIFADNGADLIIGTNPTAIQSVDLLTSSSGSLVPCYYSLGNCVAGATSTEEIIGGAAEVSITKTGKETKIYSYNFEPTITHISSKGDYYQTYMLSDYEETTSSKFHYFQTHNLKFTLEGIRQSFNDLIKVKDISAMQPSGGGMTVVQPQVPSTTTPTTPTGPSDIVITPNTNTNTNTTPTIDSSNAETVTPGISNIQIK